MSIILSPPCHPSPPFSLSFSSCSSSCSFSSSLSSTCLSSSFSSFSSSAWCSYAIPAYMVLRHERAHLHLLVAGAVSGSFLLFERAVPPEQCLLATWSLYTLCCCQPYWREKWTHLQELQEVQVFICSFTRYWGYRNLDRKFSKGLFLFVCFFLFACFVFNWVSAITLSRILQFQT